MKSALQVTFEFVKNNYPEKVYDVLKTPYQKKNGSTVQAKVTRNTKFDDLEQVRLRNNDWTIAHELALQGYDFDDPEILRYKNSNGVSVAQVMSCYKLSQFLSNLLGG